MYHLLKVFFLSMISQKLLFYFFLSMLVLIFHISLLLSDIASHKTHLCMICICLGMFTLFMEILFLSISWGKSSKIGPQKLTIILLLSLGSHFVINFLHSGLLIDTKLVCEPWNFELVLLISFSYQLLPYFNIKIVMLFLSFIGFAVKWRLMWTEITFSFYYSILFLIWVVHLIFIHLNPPPPARYKKAKTLSSDKNIKMTSCRTSQVEKNMTGLEYSVRTTVTPKSTYSNMILNAVKEGIVVFDRNLNIKWQNKYILKILTFGTPDLHKFHSKVLNIKQDEDFLRLQSNFLKTRTHYAKVFKAFQTRMEPLKSSYELSEKEGTPLLSCALKPRQSTLIFRKVTKSLEMIPDSKSMEMAERKLSNNGMKRKKYESEFFLNSNIELECETKSKKDLSKTLREFLREIFKSMDTSLMFTSSDLFTFDRFNMYGRCYDNITNESKMFLIRFFPHKDEVVVMLKYMPENDLVITAMNDTVSQNRLFASMCHELRTPLNYTTNILELMQVNLKENKSDDINFEYVDQALMNSKLLISSVNDFLDYFRVASNNFKISPCNFNLHSILTECFNLFKFVAERRGLTYNFIYDNSISEEFFNDEKRIGQIVLNLLNNAFKYTESGSIILEAKRVLNSTNYVQISVKDTGIGINSNVLQSLGKISANDSLSQTTGGFGICISNHLANFIGPEEGTFDTRKLYKGLRVQTQSGKGTKISFIVSNSSSDGVKTFNAVSLSTLNQGCYDKSPLDSFFERKDMECKFLNTVKKTKNSETVFSSSEALRNCSCCKVLAVDDNQFNLMVLTEKFKKADILIDVAQSGNLAIEKIKAIIEENESAKFCKTCRFYKLILMDIDMPVKNGYETTKELVELFHEKNVSAPIVALSAFSLIESRDKAVEAGMSDYVEKPINQEKFDYLIRNYLSDDVY